MMARAGPNRDTRGRVVINQLMDADSEGRGRDIVHKFEPNSHRSIAQRHPEIGADAEIQRQGALTTEVVDLEYEGPAAAIDDDQIGLVGGWQMREKRRRRSGGPGEIVGDAADAYKKVRKYGTHWRIVDQPDGATDVVEPAVDVNDVDAAAFQR